MKYTRIRDSVAKRTRRETTWRMRLRARLRRNAAVLKNAFKHGGRACARRSTRRLAVPNLDNGKWWLITIMARRLTCHDDHPGPRIGIRGACPHLRFSSTSEMRKARSDYNPQLRTGASHALRRDAHSWLRMRALIRATILSNMKISAYCRKLIYRVYLDS